jgi:hypothetical protein
MVRQPSVSALWRALEHSAEFKSSGVLYDRADGHSICTQRTNCSLRNTAERNNPEVTKWSYWGLPLVPAVLVRKLWVAGEQDEDKIISAVFDSRISAINRLLWLVSRCEPIPRVPSVPAVTPKSQACMPIARPAAGATPQIANALVADDIRDLLGQGQVQPRWSQGLWAAF